MLKVELIIDYPPPDDHLHHLTEIFLPVIPRKGEEVILQRFQGNHWQLEVKNVTYWPSDSHEEDTHLCIDVVPSVPADWQKLLSKDCRECKEILDLEVPG